MSIIKLGTLKRRYLIYKEPTNSRNDVLQDKKLTQGEAMVNTDKNNIFTIKTTKKNLNNFLNTSTYSEDHKDTTLSSKTSKQVDDEQLEPTKMNGIIKSTIKRATKEDKVKALNMAKNGSTPEEIAQATGFVSRTIRQWLEEAEEPITTEKIQEVIQLAEQKFSRDEIHWRTLLSIKNIHEIRKRLVVLKYIQGKSVNEICTAYNIDDDVITKMLREAGINKLKQQEMNTLQVRLQNVNGEYESYRPISAYLEELIIGNVFGDANLKLQTKSVKKRESLAQPLPSLETYEKALKFFQYTQKLDISAITTSELSNLLNEYNNASKSMVMYPTACFRMGVSLLELRYLEHGIVKKLTEHNYQTHLSIHFEKAYNNSKFTGNYKLKIRLQTINTVQLATKYQQWYPNTTKIIPRDINFIGNSIFLLYVDDGSYTKDRRNYNAITKTYGRSTIEISTESFIKDDLQFFVDKIHQLVGVKFHIIRSKNNRWRIGLFHKEVIQQFLNYITANADLDLLSIAKQEFPWKFDHNLTKKNVLNERRNQSNPDPLVILSELRFPKERIKDQDFINYINNLLKLSGSKIQLTGTLINTIEDISQ